MGNCIGSSQKPKEQPNTEVKGEKKKIPRAKQLSSRLEREISQCERDIKTVEKEIMELVQNTKELKRAQHLTAEDENIRKRQAERLLNKKSKYKQKLEFMINEQKKCEDFIHSLEAFPTNELNFNLEAIEKYVDEVAKKKEEDEIIQHNINNRLKQMEHNSLRTENQLEADRLFD